MLFCSDALNLADLFRLCPDFAGLPSVAYFHCNQLPDLAHPSPDVELGLANLNTATVATELWFNSRHHLGSFGQGVDELIHQHEELQQRNFADEIAGKCRVMPPPINFAVLDELTVPASRDPHLVFVDLHDANRELLNAGLKLLHATKLKIKLLTVGPVAGLTDVYPHQQIHDHDLLATLTALASAGTYLSAKIAAPFDETALLAVALGCRPVFPDSGFYPGFLPEDLHTSLLYDMTAESLAEHLRKAVFLPARFTPDEPRGWIAPFDSLVACRRIDDRLSDLAAHFPAKSRRIVKAHPV